MNVTVARRWNIAIGILLVLNLGLAALALGRGTLDVTEGTIVAGGIGLTIAIFLVVRLLPFPTLPSLHGQALLLGGQAVHATGHVFRLYFIYPNYDDVFHFLMVFAIGLLVLDFLLARKLPRRLRRRPYAAIAVFFFAVAGTALWEIFEFTMDIALGTREQDDLADTVLDMAYGSAGALVAAIFSWIYLSRPPKGDPVNPSGGMRDVPVVPPQTSRGTSR